MEFDALLEQRRSIRRYQAQPVGKEQIEQMIEAAIQAPTWKNSQTGSGSWRGAGSGISSAVMPSTAPFWPMRRRAHRLRRLCRSRGKGRCKGNASFSQLGHKQKRPSCPQA